MAPINQPKTNCWVTLVTRPSYLPGVIILAHTLDKTGSKYPLVVQYTSSLGDEAIEVLRTESTTHGRIIPVQVDLLTPPAAAGAGGMVAERFQDTFTKLRAFEVYKYGYTKACMLDADMAVFQNPDTIFDVALPDSDWLGASHACVCNLDKDKWAPTSWNKGNCAYTTLTSPDQVFGSVVGDCRPTYRLLNGGAFLFHPSKELWQKLLNEFETSSKLNRYQFPDQDFLAEFFWDKWRPISWKYNALKTMRYWHPKLWSDKEVVIVHYIVDKPWDRKVTSGDIAGHLGRDGETHRWWWNIYEDWLQERKGSNSPVVDIVTKLVGTKEPFTVKVPLPQRPGEPRDVATFLPS